MTNICKLDLKGKHFINLENFTPNELQFLIEEAQNLKSKVKSKEQIDLMKNKIMVMYFAKPSLRTRLSFEIGMKKLGGDAYVLKQDEIILGKRESIKDSANVISRYCDLIMIRTFAHEDIENFAKNSKVPVINALTDLSHPCQIMADLLTIKEHFGKLEGLTLSYIGDGNNVCNSLLVGCSMLGLNVKVGCPNGYEPSQKYITLAKKYAKENGTFIEILNDPKEASCAADVLYTDVWASMGQENEKEMRKEIFKDYQINNTLLKNANDNAIVLHCLPAHKGEEISEDVFDKNANIIYEEAENRMYAQMAIMKSICC